ncbi:hypothetical protein ACFVVU_03875 [Kitasatospora sp. NPDC057965]|uniref:hypothetical protein n=1 Tax=Kitasatospora sp. NPDC057965 TaxID=3346291 RepID=UPI0036DAFB1F
MSTLTATPGASALGVTKAAALRHRTSLLTLFGVLSALGALFWAHGWYVHDGLTATGADTCDPASDECITMWKNFLREYGAALQVGDSLLYALGGAFGAFLGGPLLAREFEHGTYRFAWTQGAGRARWTVGVTALAGAALAAGSLLLALVLAWWNAPLAQESSRFGRDLFVQGAPVMVARSLLTFAVAVLAGAVLRRTVVAIGIALAVSVALPFVAEAVRFNYLPPMERTVQTLNSVTTDQSWVSSVWFSDVAGNRYTSDEFYRKVDTFTQGRALLRDGSFTAHEVYQPAHRYWPFQWIEAGWMFLLALLLATAALWWVRRRAV